MGNFIFFYIKKILDEISSQIELTEPTHFVIDSAFLSKIDDLRRKSLFKVSGNFKAPHAMLDEIISSKKLENLFVSNDSKLLRKRNFSRDSIKSLSKTPPLIVGGSGGGNGGSSGGGGNGGSSGSGGGGSGGGGGGGSGGSSRGLIREKIKVKKIIYYTF